jgi:hypothetical protein
MEHLPDCSSYQFAHMCRHVDMIRNNQDFYARCSLVETLLAVVKKSDEDLTIFVDVVYSLSSYEARATLFEQIQKQDLLYVFNRSCVWYIRSLSHHYDLHASSSLMRICRSRFQLHFECILHLIRDEPHPRVLASFFSFYTDLLRVRSAPF